MLYDYLHAWLKIATQTVADADSPLEGDAASAMGVLVMHGHALGRTSLQGPNSTEATAAEDRVIVAVVRVGPVCDEFGELCWQRLFDRFSNMF